MDNFPGNSKSSKKDSVESKEKIAPVTTNVVVKKESELKKLRNQFFTEDAKSVKGHIFTDVVIPGIQRLLSDIVKNGIDWLIYGVRGSITNRSGVRGVSYSKFYDSTSSKKTSPTPTSRSNVYSVNEVTFIDRGEAEAVLERLLEEIDRYDMVSVGDFYDMISQKHSFTDLNYGWKDLSTAEIVRSRDGYSIKFPKITPLQ